jgi:hypothetical protein
VASAQAERERLIDVKQALMVDLGVVHRDVDAALLLVILEQRRAWQQLLVQAQEPKHGVSCAEEVALLHSEVTACTARVTALRRVHPNDAAFSESRVEEIDAQHAPPAPEPVPSPVASPSPLPSPKLVPSDPPVDVALHETVAPEDTVVVIDSAAAANASLPDMFSGMGLASPVSNGDIPLASTVDLSSADSSEVDAIEDPAQVRQKRRDELQRKIDTTNTELDAARAEVEQLQGLAAQFKERTADLTAKVDAAAAAEDYEQADVLTQELSAVQGDAQYVDLDARIVAAENAVSQHEADVHAFTDELTGLQDA